MANWKNNIEIEVRLPYITQGCTLGYYWHYIKLTNEDIWFSGDVDSLRWKADIRRSNLRLLISGKATTKDGKTCETTTYKLTAFITYNGINNGLEKYKVRLCDYN